jgi:uncharacterized protein (TIGR02996 family)
MRTFTFSDAKSHKFWNIDVQGKSFTVNYGKIGTAGQTQTKAFPTAEKAQAEADKLIREKTKKGYVETTPKAHVSDAEAFEKALIATPDDGAGWRAYADYLMEQGDPRGEFMQVQLALESETLAKQERTKLRIREQDLLKKHREEWLGPLAPFILNPEPTKATSRDTAIKYRFRRGWLAELEFPWLSVEQTRALLKCPEARLLNRLHVHTNAYEYQEGAANIPEWADTYAPGRDLPKDVDHYEMSYHLLSRFPHFESVRHFHLGNPVTADGADSDQCHTNGHLAHHYVKRMPHIEELRLLCHGVNTRELFALPMPNLRVLQVFHAHRYAISALLSNRTLGNVTQLLLQAHAPDDPAPYIGYNELMGICQTANLPKLTHLLIRYTDFGDNGAFAIINSGILKRLKVLDLHGGCITDDGAKALAKCPDLKHLERLDLDMNALTPTGVKLLEKTGVKVTAKNQHTSVPPFGDELPLYLFNADIE